MPTLPEVEARLAGLETTASLAWWEMACDSSEATSAAAEAASAAMEHMLADPEVAAAAVPVAETALEQRRAEVLRLMTAGRQRPADLIDRVVALETELMGMHSTYRATYDGSELDAAAVDRVLMESTDLAEREQVWRSARGVGAAVDPSLRELVRLRNEGARALGHRDHYAMTLANDELDEQRLYGLFDALHLALEPAWTAERELIAMERRAALGLAADAPLMPWHLVDVFGQDPPSVGEDPLEAVISEVDALGSAARYFADLGADVDGVIARSDVLPRPGKDQHAFMMHVDRAGDVRVLMNLAPTVRWLETTLHELGHAIYELELAADLPWLLRSPAHILTTEAIAMLHGRRGRDPEFLERYAGVDPAIARHPANAATLRAARRLALPDLCRPRRRPRSCLVGPRRALPGHPASSRAGPRCVGLEDSPRCCTRLLPQLFARRDPRLTAAGMDAARRGCVLAGRRCDGGRPANRQARLGTRRIAAVGPAGRAGHGYAASD